MKISNLKRAVLLRTSHPAFAGLRCAQLRTSHFIPRTDLQPTGQGTVLGLSLSYDIVKAHRGELKLETLPAEAAPQAGKEGEGLPAGQAGSIFTIILPITIS